MTTGKQRSGCVNLAPMLGEITAYRLVDGDHNTWSCECCGYIFTFEADGPKENGWDYCPHCQRTILFQTGDEFSREGEV